MEKLIVKFLSDSLTQEELEKLRDWLAIPDNQKVFESYVKSNQDLLQLLHSAKADETYPKIWNKIKESEKPVKKLNSRIHIYTTSAAALVLLLGSVLIMRHLLSPRVVVEDLVDTGKAVVLKLGNGQTQVLNMSDTLVNVTNDGSVKGVFAADQLNYYQGENAQAAQGAPEKNTIEVPNGRQFKLVLSDSTIVYLNSGTTFTYPVHFANADKREVFLQGEAFFDVTSDKHHPFVVCSDDIHVEVLGTRFNFSGYEKQYHSEVVLVEGAVKMAGKKTKGYSMGEVILKPGFKGELHKDTDSIAVEEVDTYLFTAWMNGKLIFRDKTFNEILETLERHFNVKIINRNEELGASRFNTSFGKDVKLERILFYFKKVYGMDYSIEENTIIIK